jgi:hypothetical protein
MVVVSGDGRFADRARAERERIVILEVYYV